MNWVKVLGVVFLAVYLILTGFGVAIPVGTYDLVRLFAVVAGVLMLFGVKECCSVCHHHHDDK